MSDLYLFDTYYFIKFKAEIIYIEVNQTVKN